MILKDPMKFNNKIVSVIKLGSLNIIENIQITNNTLHHVETSLEYNTHPIKVDYGFMIGY
jgi:hypothetical protein